MAGKRKLFIMHAGELANRLVHAFKHNGLVVAFVRRYAQRYKRAKLISDPERIRELELTIGREALLSVAVEIRRLVPRAFTDGTRSAAVEQATLADAFFAEFVAALGRSLDWPSDDVAAERQALERDLEMYWRWRQRSAAASYARRSSVGESPFPDRCAILLDPPMMEQARRAAAEFETEALRTGARILDRLGRHSIDSPRRTSRPVTKSQRPARKVSPRRTSSGAKRAPGRVQKISGHTKSRAEKSGKPRKDAKRNTRERTPRKPPKARKPRVPAARSIRHPQKPKRTPAPGRARRKVSRRRKR